MRDKFNKFMQGRYGVDDLSRFTMGVALVLIILAMFANIFSRTVGSTLDILGVAAIVYAYIRIFSRNIQQRYAENQKFLQMTSKFRFRFNKEKDLMKQRILMCTVLFTAVFAENCGRDTGYRDRSH